MKTKANLQDLKAYIPGKTIPGTIKLASNENALGCSELAKKTYLLAVNNLNIYPDGYCQQLRTKLADSLCVDPDNLIFGNGSDELLLMIAAAFVEAGDEVITSELTFSEYTFSTKIFAGQIKYAPMIDFKFNLNAIKKMITNKTRLIYLCNPNNPTGTYFSDLPQFLAEIPPEIVVVSDEAYYEYVQAEDFPRSIELMKKFKNLIVLRTFSKIYGLAALRIGYGIADPDLIDIMSKVKQPFNVNAVAQQVALAALSDHDFVKRSQLNNQQGKDYLYKQLDRLGLKYLPTQTNFIFIYDLPLCAQEIFQKLLDKKIVIRPMDSFGYPQAIRVTIGTPQQNQLFIKELEAIL